MPGQYWHPQPAGHSTSSSWLSRPEIDSSGRSDLVAVGRAETSFDESWPRLSDNFVGEMRHATLDPASEL